MTVVLMFAGELHNYFCLRVQFPVQGLNSYHNNVRVFFLPGFPSSGKSSKYAQSKRFWLFGLIIMKTSVFGITDIPTCHCFDYDSQIAIAVIVISRELQKLKKIIIKNK